MPRFTQPLYFVCLFVLRFNVPVNNFKSCRDKATNKGNESILQGHNIATKCGSNPRPHRLEPKRLTLGHCAPTTAVSFVKVYRSKELMSKAVQSSL